MSEVDLQTKNSKELTTSKEVYSVKSDAASAKENAL
jgi:hypothetical protein